MGAGFCRRGDIEGKGLGLSRFYFLTVRKVDAVESPFLSVLRILTTKLVAAGAGPGARACVAHNDRHAGSLTRL